MTHSPGVMGKNVRRLTRTASRIRSVSRRRVFLARGRGFEIPAGRTIADVAHLYWTTTVSPVWRDCANFVAEPIFHHSADPFDERNRLLFRAPAQAVA